MMLETTISPCRAHIWKIASASALCYKIMAMGFWQKQDNIHIPDWKEAVFLGMNGSQQAIHQEACHVLTQSHGSKKKREAGVTARMSHGSWGEFSVFEGNMFFFLGGGGNIEITFMNTSLVWGSSRWFKFLGVS